jgi:uncharacterized protein YlxW (UPF0749 family)
MPADRPSREFRLEHMADGERVMFPVTDPPEAIQPPAGPVRASVPPGRVQSWALVIVAVLGAGGAPSLVQAIRGDDGQAAAVGALTREVTELRGAVARLEGQVRETSERLTGLRATVEAREQARREQLAQARSHLTGPPRPDVPGAIRVLDE